MQMRRLIRYFDHKFPLADADAHVVRRGSLDAFDPASATDANDCMNCSKSNIIDLLGGDPLTTKSIGGVSSISTSSRRFEWKSMRYSKLCTRRSFRFMQRD